MRLAATLALLAVLATAEAGEFAQPVAGGLVLLPSPEQEARKQAAERALVERRAKMIDDCQQSHGSKEDCEREVDTELRAEGSFWGIQPIRRLRPPG